MAEATTSLEQGTSAEELAYLLLEEARLRCEALIHEADEGWEEVPGINLTAIYGDLGMAGYHASARLDPTRRQQLLVQAHLRCERGVGSATGSVHALADVTSAATRSVERALAITGLLDHMHLAHVHVMTASEALEAAFVLQG